MGVNLGPFFLSNIRDEVQNSGFKEFVSTPGSSILRWGWIPSLAVLQDIILITTTISLNRCKAAYTLTDAEKRLEIMMSRIIGVNSNCYHGYSIDEALEGIAAAGFHYVELTATKDGQNTSFRTRALQVFAMCRTN